MRTTKSMLGMPMCVEMMEMGTPAYRPAQQQLCDEHSLLASEQLPEMSTCQREEASTAQTREELPPRSWRF